MAAVMAVAVMGLLAASGEGAGPENLALGRPYTLSVPPTETWHSLLSSRGLAWPDIGTALTDGEHASGGSFWTSSEALNFTGMGHVDIRLDLGSVQPIGEVVAHHMARPVSGIRLHERDEFFVSDDGETWEKIGEHRSRSDPPDPDDAALLSAGRFPFSTGEIEASGRYVLIRSHTFAPGRLRLRRYVGVDEIEVRRGRHPIEESPQPRRPLPDPTAELRIAGYDIGTRDWGGNGPQNAHPHGARARAPAGGR